MSATSVVVSFNPRARDGRDNYDLHTIQQNLGFNPRARDGRD